MDILELLYSDVGQILIWLPTILFTLLILAIIVTTVWVFFPILFLIMINRLKKINRQLTRLIEIKEKELNTNADKSPTLRETTPQNPSESNKNESL